MASTSIAMAFECRHEGCLRSFDSDSQLTTHKRIHQLSVLISYKSSTQDGQVAPQSLLVHRDGLNKNGKSCFKCPKCYATNVFPQSFQNHFKTKEECLEVLIRTHGQGQMAEPFGKTSTPLIGRKRVRSGRESIALIEGDYRSVSDTLSNLGIVEHMMGFILCKQCHSGIPLTTSTIIKHLRATHGHRVGNKLKDEILMLLSSRNLESPLHEKFKVRNGSPPIEGIKIVEGYYCLAKDCEGVFLICNVSNPFHRRAWRNTS